MLLNIFKKEMKDAFRDRRTLLLTVLLPILMMTALTFFYEGMMSDSEGDSYTLAVSKDVSDEQLALFQGDKSIDVAKVEDPESSVKDGDALAAVVFSNDFMGSVQRGEEATVTIVGDSMSENSSLLMSKVTAYLSGYEKSVTAERLKSEGLDESTIQPFTMTQQELSEEDTGLFLIALIIPMMMALAIGIGAGPVSADLFAGERKRKQWKPS
ncbi:ABC transporter permease subunit [Rossellomorea sp. H39__3]